MHPKGRNINLFKDLLFECDASSLGALQQAERDDENYRFADAERVPDHSGSEYAGQYQNNKNTHNDAPEEIQERCVF